MNDYELMVIMDPRIGDEEMPQALESAVNTISVHGGEIGEPVTAEPWGRRRLSFPINEQTEGYYAVYTLKMDPAQSREVDRDMKLNEQVLRFLVTRTNG